MELLEQMGEKIRAHHGSGERIETAKAKAERILAEEMERRRWSAADLERRRKAAGEKIKIARRLRAETTMTWAWIAERLVMVTSGHGRQSAPELTYHEDM